MNVSERIFRLIKTGQGGIVLTTVEPEQCIADIRLGVMDANWLEFYTWSIADGLRDKLGNPFTFPNRKKEKLSASSALFTTERPGEGKLNDPWERCALNELLDWLLVRIQDIKQAEELGESLAAGDVAVSVVIRNADRILGGSEPNLMLLAQMQQIVTFGTECGINIILQTAPGFTVPVELAEYCEYVEHELPNEEDREVLLLKGGIKKELITPEVQLATAGLSGAKALQFVAESIVGTPRRVDAAQVFRSKAIFLGKNAKLDVWSPQFQTEVKLRPTEEAEGLENATEVVMLEEVTSATNEAIPEGHVRAKIRFLSRTDKQRHTRQLEQMPQDVFERIYRPHRDEYSFNSVVGLDGVKNMLRNAMRPGVPDRARMRHILLLGVPGVGKSMLQRCASGEFGLPLTSMQSANLYSKWLGDTDKALFWMLKTVSQIGGILGIDEFQRFLPLGSNSENGTENRVLGTLLTWLNDQTSNLVLSAANNISKLPDEITRSGRIDALVFVGFPGREAKDAAWKLYMRRHELPDQELPDDSYWTPADIQSCCRLSEMQNVPIVVASKWITPSYSKNPEQMETLMRWAAAAGCVCAETGDRFDMSIALDIGNAKSSRSSRKEKVQIVKTTARRIIPDIDSTASVN